MGFSGSIGLWLSYHKLPIWECLQNGVPQTFFFHLKKVWGTHVGTPILRHPHMFSTGHPHMSEHPGIIRHHQETPRDSSNHSLGHQCSLSGSIGLWLSYHKLPICLPQVTHICQTTQGKIGHHQETPRNSSNHALGHQCSFSGPIGLWLKYPYFNHRSPTYVRTPRNN